jgi:hypothetical protein
LLSDDLPDLNHRIVTCSRRALTCACARINRINENCHCQHSISIYVETLQVLIRSWRFPIMNQSMYMCVHVCYMYPNKTTGRCPILLSNCPTYFRRVVRRVVRKGIDKKSDQMILKRKSKPEEKSFKSIEYSGQLSPPTINLRLYPRYRPSTTPPPSPHLPPSPTPPTPKNCRD